MLGRLAYAALAAVVLALWALMKNVLGPVLKKHAGDLSSFDARLWGYGFDEAKAYLAALDTTGRDLYLEALHRIDGIFIPVFALFLIWSFAILLPTWAAVIMSLVAVAAAGADLTENYRVAEMLRATMLTPEMVTAASNATRLKGALYLLEIGVFVGAILVAVYRRIWPHLVEP